ncbi:twin-arginine translocase subunit TatE, partial [Shigella sonnei]|uniref:twin-arginine translocase subunit TatE n=1 Tax=Shigella sonnei TaxID=624 RepID=UPI0020935C5E
MFPDFFMHIGQALDLVSRYDSLRNPLTSLGEISITKLLVVAALVVLLFGTKKLRTLGGDLGAAIKGFKKAMNDDDAAA